MTPDAVLDWWFAGAEHQADKAMARVAFWFRGGAELDAEILARFGEAIAQAERGELDAWAEAPRGRLALVILLDQFTRNAHRGSPRMFASDTRARELVKEGLAKGHFDSLQWVEQLFFELPLIHSEELGDHRLAIPIVERWAAQAPPELGELARLSLGQAQKHTAVLERFGRYPSRNAVLGRASTPEELSFLESGPGW